MKRVLFVCGKNRLRSPTAEQLFSTWPGIEAASAGVCADADEPLTGEMVAEADLIFVMEKAHRTKLNRRFRAQLKSTRVICLDIPDDYVFMDPELIRLLEARVPRFLPAP
ncbi:MULTISPECIES: low molecular weight protein tyrosine phosphatase family protein [unclassified Caulobacter]|uniref:low molecular weight protein tyrosine phosphatase family protein n=1 Tax=unclassified Caulobacter TaxID=2648921 RepID=UPI000D3B9FC4|nr:MULTISPECIES: low molecular weight protein tyrosine phosphatase family protein [unclassified Caulobacter]PTS86596.1 protein tyrosine phosphatase [Caulobacter sp. HMWF009]PTT13055.1 protein tyrosine phosphatase [Caulobacter sp. HMWF025]PTT75405.1 protein tyrosine phosphatase [Pseudomonas sp. HMWF010]